MGVQTQFNKFHDNIRFGREDEAYRKARKRDNSITNAVKTAFKDKGYPVIKDFIQGSLATHTAIIPLDGDFDIDRALVIDADSAPDNPVDPKKVTLDVLEKRGFKSAKIKMPCVTADYSSESVHIDFPIYKKQGDQHYLAVGKKTSSEDNREWSAAAPKELINWVNNGANSSELDQYRRLVRYLKRWRDWQFSNTVGAKVYSIGLTVMAKEQYQPALDTEGFGNDLVALRKMVSAILDGGYFRDTGNDKYNVSVSLPKQPWRDIFDGSSLDTGTQLRNKLTTMKNKLEEAEAKDDVTKQCEILNKLFGDDFPVPSATTEKAKAVYSSAGAVGTSQGA